MIRKILILSALLSVSNLVQSQDKMTYSFLALGDSYTIGESVEESKRWPIQLSNVIAEKGTQLDPVKIIATTGWTTDELTKGIEKANISEKTYDLVSLLIGVNNQYRGYPIENYKKEFEALLQQSIKFAGGNKDRVFVVSIPDYGVTPFAREKDPEKIGKEIDQYNQLAKEIATSYNIKFFDITPISREALEKPSYVASDGLHPSGEMYEKWVEIMVDWTINALK